MASVKDYLAKIGSKGGKTTGASKRRPKAHYERLAAMKRKKAKRKSGDHVRAGDK